MRSLFVFLVCAGFSDAFLLPSGVSSLVAQGQRRSSGVFAPRFAAREAQKRSARPSFAASNQAWSTQMKIDLAKANPKDVRILVAGSTGKFAHVVGAGTTDPHEAFFLLGFGQATLVALSPRS